MSLVKRTYVANLEPYDSVVRETHIEFIEDAIVTGDNTNRLKGYAFYWIELTRPDGEVFLLNTSHGWYLAPKGSVLKYRYSVYNNPIDSLLIVDVYVSETHAIELEFVLVEGEALSLIAQAAWVATGHDVDLEPEPPTLRDSGLSERIAKEHQAEIVAPSDS